MLENLLVARAKGDMTASTQDYEQWLGAFVGDPEIKPLLPRLVWPCRILDVFWPFIKKQAGTYAERRQIIGEAFTPLMERLESRNRAPGDAVVSDALQSFDADGVHAVWSKALSRRNQDPEGVITVARTLLETVCQRILDDIPVTYSDKENFSKLYSMAAKALNLAPDLHHQGNPWRCHDVGQWGRDIAKSSQ